MIRLTQQEILGLITAAVVAVLIAGYLFALPIANALAAGFQVLAIACETMATALGLPGGAGWFVLWSLSGSLVAAGLMLLPAPALPADADADDVRSQIHRRLSLCGALAGAALAAWVFVAVLTA